MTYSTIHANIAHIKLDKLTTFWQQKHTVWRWYIYMVGHN